MAELDNELLQQAVSRLAIFAADYEPRLEPVCDALRDALRDGDPSAFQQAVKSLQNALLRFTAPVHPAQPLQALVAALEAQGAAGDELAAIRRALEEAADGDELARLAERLARLCRGDGTASTEAGASSTTQDATRVCAALVAEILQQLMERVTLPEEFGVRVERLRLRLEEGVQAGQWEGLLTEVAELAADIRLRLHKERSATHRFLRQMDRRLVEMDEQLRGRVERSEAARAEGEAIHRAVRDEVDGLHRQLDDADDLERLRLVVRRRVESVNLHLSRFQALQAAQSEADQAELTALRRRLAELEKETRALRRRLEEQRRKALVDGLTGIPNRLAFEERMQQEYARWRRFAEPLSLVVWDVDHFKQINDRLGHQAGDKVLKVIAKTLSQGIRETDFLARYGGEEFVVLMPGTDLAGARTAAEKLRQRIAGTPFKYRGSPLEITLSAGIAQFHEGDDPRRVFDRADEALYRAKAAGRNRCELERLSGSSG